MQEMSISIITVITFCFGTACGFLFSKFILKDKSTGDISNLKSRSELNESLNKKLIDENLVLSNEIKDMSGQLRESHLSMSRLESEILKMEGQHIKETEEEKRTAYELGTKDALKDFKVIFQPFIDIDDGFFKKTLVAGYRYHLIVKGAPALEPKDVIIRKESKFDDNVKKAILDSVSQAIKIAAASCGLPVIELPLNEIHKKNNPTADAADITEA